MDTYPFETGIFDTFSYCVWSWEVPCGCEMQQSDKSKLKWLRFVTKYNFRHTSHSPCWFKHRRRASSPEDIKRKEGGRNKIFYLHPKHPCNELMIPHIWNCWHCQLPWEWISLFISSLQYVKNIPKLGVCEHFLRANLLHYTIRELQQVSFINLCPQALCEIFLPEKEGPLLWWESRRQSASHQIYFNPTTCLLFSEVLFFLLVQGIERTKQAAPS